MKHSTEFDWTSAEAEKYLYSLSLPNLGKRLLLVRAQQKLAHEQGKTTALENLQAHEDAIIRVRVARSG